MLRDSDAEELVVLGAISGGFRDRILWVVGIFAALCSTFYTSFLSLAS